MILLLLLLLLLAAFGVFGAFAWSPLLWILVVFVILALFFGGPRGYYW